MIHIDCLLVNEKYKSFKEYVKDYYETIRIALLVHDECANSLADYTCEELIDMGYEDIDIFMEDVPHKSCELAYNIRKNITIN